ncbi:hypothetical protein SALBM135S_00235 [Streptomyces alboniger]
MNRAQKTLTSLALAAAAAGVATSPAVADGHTPAPPRHDGAAILQDGHTPTAPLGDGHTPAPPRD